MDLDANVFSSPVMLEKEDGTSYLFIKDIERGNFDEEKIAARVMYYRPYFTFDRRQENIPDHWLEFLPSLLAREKLAVDDSVYFSAYEALCRQFPEMAVSGSPPWWRVYLYEVACGDVLNEFKSSCSAALADAGLLVAGLCRGKDVAEFLEDTGDSRYDLLDGLLKEFKINALLVSSPLNAQEISGIPCHYLANVPSLVVYSEQKIYILTTRPIEQTFPKLKGIFPNLEQAFQSLGIDRNKAIGIEENHLAYQLYRELGLAQYEVRATGAVLRKWREDRAGEELPFYLIAAQVTRFGIETALAAARASLERGEAIYETDVENHLYAAYQDFKLFHQLSTAIQPYFVVLHTGERTRRPNLPQFAQVNRNTKTLKVDAGVLVIDRRGLIRAVSDLCRTLPLDSAAQELYAELDRLMVDVAIPSALPGRPGEQVYLAGVRDLIGREEQFVKLGVLPPGHRLGDRYDRNIGHVLGKQEPATLVFEKGNRFALQAGMIACVEYQWPYYPYAVGVEDMFLVSAQGTLNLTR